MGAATTQVKVEWGNEWWKNSLNSILEKVNVNLPGIVQDNIEGSDEESIIEIKNKKMGKSENISSEDDEDSTSSEDTIKEKKIKKINKKLRKLTEDFEVGDNQESMLKKKRKRNFKMIKL